MAHKAVFVDRDNTLIEDPGYLADPDALRLLPGAELAVKTFMQAGYKVIVVTNQSGVARGILTEKTLGVIHDRLRQAFESKGAHLDAIYYCPFHPEGSVEEYAKESDLRKPSPGMLLKAAEDMNIDLSGSWMIGDSGRDIGAGQRAGCKTIRVRKPQSVSQGAAQDENVQADFTVRNIVEAARIVLRHSEPMPPNVPEESRDQVIIADEVVEEPATDSASTSIASQAFPQHQPEARDMRDRTHIAMPAIRTAPEFRPACRPAERVETFSVSKCIAGAAQGLAIALLVGLLVLLIRRHEGWMASAQLMATVAGVFQVMALTFFVMHRDETN
jgi:D-glycero-D-manno-heptose 1,7-bisphosphate phosphatase